MKHLLNWDTWKLLNYNGSYSYRIMIAAEIEGIAKNEFYNQPELQPTRPDINFVPKLNLAGNYYNADFAFVPHSWRLIQNNKEYINYLRSLSAKIPLLILNTGDISPKCNLPNTLELRTFLHPWENSFRKIVLPWPVVGRKFTIRQWRQIPRVSFMGYVPKLGLGSMFGENFNGITKPIKSSVYINRKVTIYRLKKIDKYFDVTSISRNSFTALNSNPYLAQHSIEYENLLAESDYVICPRGFGNSTVRFYEVISSGATPILINSGGKLPKLKKRDFWDNNIVHVDLFSNWRVKIEKDWKNLGEKDNYLNRQQESKDVFKNELQFENYLRNLFTNYLR